jgi:isopenicillin N synthase-like dioxygenase
MAIPIVDFSHFLGGTQQQKKDAAKEIDEAFQSVGFVYLKNHSVPKEEVESCFNWVCSPQQATSHISRLTVPEQEVLQST